MFDGWVGVNDETHVVNVDAACRNIGGNKCGCFTGMEGVHGARAGVLAQVSVQLHSGNALKVELARKLFRAVLGACEHNATTGCSGEFFQHAKVIGLADVQNMVRHG